MLETVKAVRFYRKMTTGRTQPCLLECIRADGEEVEVVTKLSSGCTGDTKGLVSEAIAAMLANDLGLPIPEPFKVEISEEFINSINDDAVASLLRKSKKIAFGLKKLPPAFLSVTPESLPTSLKQQSLEVLAFDSVIQNDDRKCDNPNYLTDGKTLAIFDHELAFMFENLSYNAPWEHNGLDYMKNPYGHVFFSPLSGNKFSISRFFDALKEIGIERLNEYRLGLPECWCMNREDIEIIGYLQEAIAKASLIQDEFERMLS